MTSEFKTEPGLIGYVLIVLIFAAIAGPVLADTPYQSVTNQFLRTSTEYATAVLPDPRRALRHADQRSAN